MKSYIKLFLIFLFGLGSITAQSLIPSEMSRQNADTLRVLVAMVEFQEDNYDATIGTGKFGSHYTQAYGDTILDPLPHDAGYFSDHMEFAKNYFYKVSRGKLNLSYHVIPQVITVSKYMREYSPAYNSNDFSPLASLAEETWQIVDNTMPEITFSDYDLFILFHAGVSNSLDDGTLTLNRNLPSLYLSLKTLQSYYDDDFKGFPADNGTSFITNTIILPETESREYELINGDMLLQELTINGVIVTNIASHIGLPDLFDTNTGRSKIGRFGLMDSQASIANWGLFPPMPSAWEKILLGWDEAVTFEGNDSRVTLTASAAAVTGDTTILKVPINSSEYYLVENRIKDAENNFIVLKYKLNGNIYEKTVYPNEDNEFYIENDEIDGVLIDVDDYDASLPGDGIVIWHIDEKVIAEKGPTNEINNDKNRPGIDVEEADGIQDLGETFKTVFGDFIIGEGGQDDFWYASNPTELYSNKFSTNTKPSTISNMGGNSNITIEDFSEIGNRMSFRLRYEYDEIKQLTKKQLPENLHPKFLTASVHPTVNNLYVVDDNNDLHILDMEGNLKLSVSPFSSTKPAVTAHEGSEYIFGTSGSKLNILQIENGNYTSSDLELTKIITTPVVLSGNKIYLGFENGSVISIDIPSAHQSHFILPEIPNDNVNDPVKHLAADGNYYVWTTTDKFHSSLGEEIILTGEVEGIALTKNADGFYSTYLLYSPSENANVTTGRISSIIDGQIIDDIMPEYDFSTNMFSLADIDKNGDNALLFSSGSSLWAINKIGVLKDNYPMNDEHKIEFVTEPLIISGDENTPDKLVTITKDGRINILNALSLESTIQYPFSSGEDLAVHPILFKYDSLPDLEGGEKTMLGLINKANDLYLWELGEYTGIKWSGQYANVSNNSFVPAADYSSNTETNELVLNAYNWPNPVYENETYIRYELAENSEVTVRIFDLAGDQITEFTRSSVAGYETEISVDVSDYQSGVYFAVMEAVSSARSARKIIKIAVIK